MTTISCDIVLLPDDALSEFSITCSQTLAQQGSFFTLDNQHFFAHASLYMFELNTESQEDCATVLSELAKECSPQTLTQAGYCYQDSGSGKGYVDINFSRNSEVDHLQQSVIQTFNSLRSGMRASDKAKMLDAHGEKLENLQNYGYPAIGGLFRPHITLTKLPPEVEPDLLSLGTPTNLIGNFTRIGLFEMGMNGTCVRKIAEFAL